MVQTLLSPLGAAWVMWERPAPLLERPVSPNSKEGPASSHPTHTVIHSAFAQVLYSNWLWSLEAFAIPENLNKLWEFRGGGSKLPIPGRLPMDSYF